LQDHRPLRESNTYTSRLLADPSIDTHLLAATSERTRLLGVSMQHSCTARMCIRRNVDPLLLKLAPVAPAQFLPGIVAPTRSSLRRSTRSPLRALCHRLRGLVQMRWPSYSSALHFSSPMLPSCSPATAGARASQQVNLVLMRDGHVRDTVVREVHMVSLSRLHSRCFRDAWESRCELLVRVQIIEIDHGRPASSSSPFGRPSPASQLFRFVGRTR